MTEPNDKGILLTAGGNARGAAPSLAPAPSEMRPPAVRRFTLIGFGFLLAVAVATAAFTLVFTSKSRMIANQNNAGTVLMQLASHEQGWKQNDYDRNGQQDYWTRDVAGFHCVHDENDRPVNVCKLAIARADRAPALPYLELAGIHEPLGGYFFQAMTIDQFGEPYLKPGLPIPKAKNAPPSVCTNKARFGFTAFPRTYGQDGVLVFVIGEDGIVWQHDLGVAAPILDWKWASPEVPEAPFYTERGS